MGSKSKKAEQLVHDGKFEQAIDYLTKQSKRKDLDSVDRILLATLAVPDIFRYGEEKQALDVLIEALTSKNLE